MARPARSAIRPTSRTGSTASAASSQPKPHLDLADYPEFRKRMTAFLGPQTFRRMTCVGPVSVKDAAARQDRHREFWRRAGVIERRRRLSQRGLPRRRLLVSAQSLLPEPRGLYRGASRSAETRIRGDHARRVPAADRLSRRCHVAAHRLSGPERSRNSSSAPRSTSRRSITRSQTCRQSQCVSISAGATTRARTTTTSR